MNNEEPVLAPAANETVSTTGKPLVEQTKRPVAVIPRPLTMVSMINQWQPMGIRVVIDLPYVGNDQDFLFILRNGPFIPRWDYTYQDSWPDKTAPGIDGMEVLNLRQYAWNNMRNVYPGYAYDAERWNKSGVHITQYDYPPPLATLAACFRKWRGDMQYRFRVVAGFATQGYTIVAPIKNMFSPIATYDEYNTTPALVRQDFSYRESMMNAYVMGDTSMFRHIEISVPYEYPAPWYDQYNWMMHRVSPHSCGSEKANNTAGSVYDNQIDYIMTSEPHGDNWIAFGLRGTIQTTQTGGQVVIELEYRAQEGFQFADPGLPIAQFSRPYSLVAVTLKAQMRDKIKSVPDSTLESDGYSKITLKENAFQNRRPRQSAQITPEEHAQLQAQFDSRLKMDTLQVPTSSHADKAMVHHHRHHGHHSRSASPARVPSTVGGVIMNHPSEDREQRSRHRRDSEFSY